MNLSSLCIFPSMSQLVRCTFSGILVLLLVAGSFGCSSESGGVPQPPEGWQGYDAAWWQADVDTAVAFRDLSSLAAMGVEEASSVQRELLPIYRNAPDIVDSLYAQHLAEKMAAQTGSLEDQKREAYTSLRKHFREPIIAKHLGEDIPVPYPDSLRSENVAGKVTMQVRLDEEGHPQAIQLVERVHPALDAIALDATSQMEWRPAYVLRNGRWKPIPSWVRFSVNFRPPSS